ncbi:hypothetical protein pEaSNUABM50_00068 [Erwinia phage pEa_SNUABM_50]|uniref:Uncharacterized protein n=1 Tax=Erwinia phage pEa_SNUABM_50 TaxID=2768775 RepID=A0A7L8ZPG0_9CAUD|nr:hypothetical protein pEaSNUABM50_00068 [Erwinia phage pEa_SNUABM_50]
MVDRIKFATEMANELNMANFKSLTSVMAEYATAGAVDGVQCGQANMLADVYSTLSSTQYSVKTYKDDFVSLYMNGVVQEERRYTDPIIERRVAGVSDPNGEPHIVLQEVLQDIRENEEKSKDFYSVQNTETVLLGYSEDDQYFYFRLTEMPYEYEPPAIVDVKYFTDRSKNFNKHVGNRTSIVGFNEDGIQIYEWVHPNNQTYTRCLKKRYCLEDADSFYFKIEKQSYSRPDNSVLMGMVHIC